MHGMGNVKITFSFAYFPSGFPSSCQYEFSISNNSKVASGDDDYYDYDDDDDDYKNNELRYIGVKKSKSVWFRASTYRENLNLLLRTRREKSHTLEKI
jgi:hypothetical protein